MLATGAGALHRARKGRPGLSHPLAIRVGFVEIGGGKPCSHRGMVGFARKTSLYPPYALGTEKRATPFQRREGPIENVRLPFLPPYSARHWRAKSQVRSMRRSVAAGMGWSCSRGLGQLKVWPAPSITTKRACTAPASARAWAASTGTV